MGEFSGRIEMMKQGKLRAGAGNYEGNKGIDAVYKDHYDEKQLSILESKWRKDFKGGNPETVLNPGIKAGIDPRTKKVTYLKQMSTEWIDKVRDRLLKSDNETARRMGEQLRDHAKRDGQYDRYINVLNEKGAAVLHKMK